MSNSQKTPLYEDHVKLGARMVDFAGWIMPVQYEGLKEEHFATRTNVGLFDVSHMGEIRVKGPKALDVLYGRDDRARDRTEDFLSRPRR